MTGVDPALGADAAPALPRDGAGVPVTHRTRRSRARPASRPRHAATRPRPSPRTEAQTRARTGREQAGRAQDLPRRRRPVLAMVAVAVTDWLLWIVAFGWA